MQYDYVITGRLISKLRKERGLSQEVLSGLAGISRSHLAMIENGKKNPNVNTLWCIADALQMPLSQFFLMLEQMINNNGGKELC